MHSVIVVTGGAGFIGSNFVRYLLDDPDPQVRAEAERAAQQEEIAGMLQLKGDFVPALCPALGVVGIPSAFGCEVVWWERDFPAVRPCLSGPGEVDALGSFLGHRHTRSSFRSELHIPGPLVDRGTHGEWQAGGFARPGKSLA